MTLSKQKKGGDPYRLQKRIMAVIAVILCISLILSLVAGVLARDGDTLVLLARRKGCWVCSVPPEGSPALWLLDMIRRAAKRLPQAKGVRYCRAGRAHGAARRWRTRLLLALLLAAAVGLVLALQATGGDLSALPQLLRSLAGASQPPAHSGAIFL